MIEHRPVALLAGLIVFGATIAQEGRWTATPVIRAGAQDGPGALTAVFDVEIGPDGEMYAGQPSTGTISDASISLGRIWNLPEASRSRPCSHPPELVD